jgi:hypothetical protein
VDHISSRYQVNRRSCSDQLIILFFGRKRRRRKIKLRRKRKIPKRRKKIRRLSMGTISVPFLLWVPSPVASA